MPDLCAFLCNIFNHYLLGFIPGSSVTTISGLILLASYIVFDSFTSNWQSALFKTYGMSSVQMMCAVNLFSCLFTASSLLQQGGFIASIHFMFKVNTTCS